MLFFGENLLAQMFFMIKATKWIPPLARFARVASTAGKTQSGGRGNP